MSLSTFYVVDLFQMELYRNFLAEKRRDLENVEDFSEKLHFEGGYGYNFKNKFSKTKGDG